MNDSRKYTRTLILLTPLVFSIDIIINLGNPVKHCGGKINPYEM